MSKPNRPSSRSQTDLHQISEPTQRVERHWICGRIEDLAVFRVPIEKLYFNIENGRYADRMLRLRSEHPGEEIDAREEKWKEKIEEMLAGEHRDTTRDTSAFQRLKEDIKAREQLRPGVVLPDGGVIDGNRRLGALRRLSREEKNPSRYRYFDAVILPENTTKEDRWRIEAGLQLGVNERWDYSPVNELLKVREGLKLYEQMIASGALPRGQKPAEMVAKAIYGKEESDILEMQARLKLIDEYLEFINQPGAYDQIGDSSEDFLEARKVITAAENHQKDSRVIGRLKAALFYVIHRDMMDNYEIRNIYDALGGDPRKKGRKKKPNEKALNEFLATFPANPRDIQADLIGREPGASKRQAELPLAGAPRQDPTKPTKPATRPAPPKVDEHRVEAGIERFKRTMEAASKNKSAQTYAEGAVADLQNLQKYLTAPGAAHGMAPEEREAVRQSLRSIQDLAKECTNLLK